MTTVHDTAESADIMAAVEDEDRSRKKHDRDVMYLQDAVAAFRAANPPPAGKYWSLGLPWTADRGKMLLRDVPETRGHTYVDGTTCVEHKEER